MFLRTKDTDGIIPCYAHLKPGREGYMDRSIYLVKHYGHHPNSPICIRDLMRNRGDKIAYCHPDYLDKTTRELKGAYTWIHSDIVSEVVKVETNRQAVKLLRKEV